MRALRAHPAPGAQHAAEVLATRAPLAVCIALEAIRRAARMDTLTQVLDQDLMLAGAMADSVDFVEGVLRDVEHRYVCEVAGQGAVDEERCAATNVDYRAASFRSRALDES